MIGLNNLENSLSWGPLSIGMALMASGKMAVSTVMTKHTLKQLFRKMPIKKFRGDWKATVSCLISDSRHVVPGAIFFAVEGLHKNGNAFLEEAIDRGAVAVVSNAPMPVLCPVTYIQVGDVRTAMASVARLFYGAPDEALTIGGVTGTNGKTTVTMLTQFLLAEDKPVGLIGTVRYDLGKRSVPSYRTTPESIDLFAMLSQMQQAGCDHAVMEVSSHALDQKRVQGIHFDVVAFLNLTQDHIDYHGSMEAYWAAKKRLFTGESGHVPGIAIVNLDDPLAQDLIRQVPSSVKVRTFSTRTSADIYAKDVAFGPTFSRFTVVYAGGEVDLIVPLPGEYNVSNTLAALSLCEAMGKDVAVIAKKLADFSGVPGRMERVDAGQSFSVLVDYAHTEDALYNALTMLKRVTPGKIYVVFGCGGDRDRTKRAKMVEVVLNHAQHAWATADNPRSETLDSIFYDMQGGVTDASKITFVPDRREALRLAFEKAEAGDCVLIAGKGHEAYQELADTVVPFDDVLISLSLLKEGHRMSRS